MCFGVFVHAQIEEFLVNTESRLEATNTQNIRLQQENQDVNGSMSNLVLG